MMAKSTRFDVHVLARASTPLREHVHSCSPSTPACSLSNVPCDPSPIALNRSHAKCRVVVAILMCLGLCPAVVLQGQQPDLRQEGLRALYRGDLKGAAEIGRRLAKAQPAAASPCVLIARAEIAQGNYEAAYEELRKALRSEPNNLEALYHLGHLGTLLSQQEYQKLFALAPDSARVHQILAESHRAEENMAKAEEEYLLALKANPDLVEVLNTLGDTKRYQFKFEEAISYYSRATQVNPRDYESAYGLGASRLYLQQPKEAVEDFQRALAVQPKSAAAHLALGDALLRLGDAESAAGHLKTAIEIEPKLRQAYSLLGRSYQRLGKEAEAKAAFKTAQGLIQTELERERARKAGAMEAMVPAQAAPEDNPRTP